jgi:hypothetical protein
MDQFVNKTYIECRTPKVKQMTQKIIVRMDTPLVHNIIDIIGSNSSTSSDGVVKSCDVRSHPPDRVAVNLLLSL